MNGGCHKNTLSHSAGKLENCVTNRMTCRLIIKTIFSFSRHNGNLVGADHIMKNIRIHTGCVDDNPRPKGALCGVQQIAIFFFFYPRYFCMKVKAYPVLRRIFGIGNVHGKGTNDAAGRCIGCRINAVRQIRLQDKRLLPGQQLHPRYAVSLPPRNKRGKLIHLLLALTDNERSVAAERKIQRLCHFFHYLVAPDI